MKTTQLLNVSKSLPRNSWSCFFAKVANLRKDMVGSSTGSSEMKQCRKLYIDIR